MGGDHGSTSSECLNAAFTLTNSSCVNRISLEKINVYRRFLTSLPTAVAIWFSDQLSGYIGLPPLYKSAKLRSRLPRLTCRKKKDRQCDDIKRSRLYDTWWCFFCFGVTTRTPTRVDLTTSLSSLVSRRSLAIPPTYHASIEPL